MEIPLAPDREACCAVERLDEPARPGVRLRTRALTTTMFARLLLGDLFLHGIGGAKYDELGDEMVRGFFGVEPPGFLTLSMTSGWASADPASPERLAAVDRLLRDLTFNPDRHLDGRPHAGRPCDGSRRSGPRSPARSRPAGSAWPGFAAIRRSNEALQPLVREPRERPPRRADAAASTACGATRWPAVASIPSCSIRGGGSARRWREAARRRRPIVTTGKKSRRNLRLA